MILQDTIEVDALLKRIVDLEESVSELERTCEAQEQSKKMLRAIQNIQSLYIIQEDPAEIYRILLQSLVELSGSEFGFLDEVIDDETGHRKKKSLALSDISWDKHSRALFMQLKEHGVIFSFLDNLAGFSALTGKMIISNNPSTDSRYKGLPEGHPSIRSFMGLPIFFGGKLLCVAGLANRPNGYNDDVAFFLEPLLSTCGAITYAVRTEELTRSKEERYRTLFLNSPLGIFRSTFDGRFLEVNPALSQMLGYDSPEEVVVSITSIADQIYVRSERRDQIMAEQLVSQDTHHYISHYRKKNGAIFIANLYLKTVCDPDGTPLFLEGIVEDITELRKAEATLKESEQKFKMVADFTYDWEYWLDPVGRFIYTSPSCRRITGHGPDDFLNNPGLMEAIIHPEDRDMVIKHEKELLESEEPHCIEFRIITKAGDERWIAHICQPVYEYEAGNGRRYLGKRGSNRDITETKRLQEARITAHRMEAIGALAGGVAHQFNNALSVITGNLDLLEEAFPGSTFIRSHTRDMKGAAQRMARLTAQLLAYARGGKYQEATVSVIDFIADTIPIIGHDIPPGITLSVDPPDTDLHIQADQTQMQMVLSAILNNAAEAISEKGHIQVRFGECAMGKSTVGKELDLAPGSYAEIEISDNGGGMDKATQNRIFDPFFTTKFEGRGLGMAAAFGIVKNHGGAISVASHPGYGTTVSVYLPLVEKKISQGP